MKAVRLTVTLLAFAFMAGLAGEAHADCDSSDRMNHSSSDCLHGWWDNNTWPTKTTFGVQSFCWQPTAGGTVVAKIDIVNRPDLTWHLNNGHKRRDKTWNWIRDIHCCEDLSVLCKWNERVNNGTCEDEWNEGTGQDRCTVTIEPREPKKWNCRVTADCESEDGTQEVTTVVSIRPFDDENNIRVCPNGTVRYWIDRCRPGD